MLLHPYNNNSNKWGNKKKWGKMQQQQPQTGKNTEHFVLCTQEIPLYRPSEWKLTCNWNQLTTRLQCLLRYGTEGIKGVNVNAISKGVQNFIFRTCPGFEGHPFSPHGHHRLGPGDQALWPAVWEARGPCVHQFPGVCTADYSRREGRQPGWAQVPRHRCGRFFKGLLTTSPGCPNFNLPSSFSIVSKHGA